jgi:hypothetical protein
MYEHPWLLLAVIPIAIGFIVVLAATWERRPVQPYYIPEPGKEYEPWPAARQANQDAQDLGYQHGALCHDAKGRLYRVRYDFWVSPDDATIALIGSGTVAIVPVFGIWLWSRTTDERTLCTTNERGEQDISGVEDQQTWPSLPLRQLVEKHRQRLAGVKLEPFSAQAPLIGYFDIRRRKADALVAWGYAAYLDDQRMVWRYTLRGAIVFYLLAALVRPVRRLFRSLGLSKN